jgi:hypothetical protein
MIDFAKWTALAGLLSKWTVSIKAVNCSRDISTASMTTGSRTFFDSFRASKKLITLITAHHF